MAKRDYWFFLSYAKTDAKGDEYLKRFYKELAVRVAKSAALPSHLKEEDIGFFDEEGIETGDKWDDRLAKALCHSRAFICLYSRSYFNSEYCGKEFTAFHARIQAYATQHNETLPLILPVLWDRPFKLPKVLPQAITDAKIQYTHGDLGSVYAEEGLDYIIRLQQHKDDYERFLMNFADKLVEEAKANRLGPYQTILPLDQTVSAFHQPTSTLNVSFSGITNSAELSAVGPGVAQFVFVAGCKQELNGIKQQLNAYDNKGGRYWRPYSPADEQAAALITQRVATDTNLQHEVLPVSKELIAKLRQCEETNTIVVLVIDPWSLQIASASNRPYKDLMRDYDKARFDNCGVLVLWNEKDQDLTATAQQLLVNELDETFFRSKESRFRDAVRSVEQMQRELGTIIFEVGRRLMQRAKVFRLVENGTNSSLPTISASGGGSV